MRRNPAALADESFDLVVVGAGIHGIFAAWDAAQRGLSVALIDRGDFCGATSSNSLKTVHGGLRYLQRANFRRMRLSIRERRLLLRNAPHLVRPLPFLMPTRRRLMRSRRALRLALLANDAVSFDRNRGLRPERRLPPGRLLSLREVRESAPGLDERGVTGGALWYDAQMINTERLALACLHRGVSAGVRAVNYLEALTPTRRGLRVRDRIGDTEFELHGRVLLHAAGPWTGHLPGGEIGRPRLSKAVNVIVRPALHPQALAVGGEETRLYFLVPWGDTTMIGTTHRPYEGTPNGFEVTRGDIEFLLSDVGRVHPPACFRIEDVQFFHGGLLPATGTDFRGDSILLKHHRVLAQAASDRSPASVSIVGVKWTTARAVAEQAVNKVLGLLDRKAPPCRTAETPVHGGEIADLSELVREIAKDTGLGPDEAAHLSIQHGSAYRDLLGYLEELPGRLAPRTSVLKAEILYGIRDEMAVTLSDLVFRRTCLGAAGPPAPDALEACAAIAAKEFGWSSERIRREIETVQMRYIPAP